MTPVAVPRVEVLGIYPTAQTLAAQVVILAIIAVSIRYNLRSQNRRG
jgi:high-affinity iron transporter